MNWITLSFLLESERIIRGIKIAGHIQSIEKSRQIIFDFRLDVPK